MSLLSTFCTNSINILAGVNGIEVGQALVIACSIALNDLLYLPWPYSIHFPGGTELGGEWAAGLARGSGLLVERHLLSLYFMLPLIGVCCGLLWHNWCVCRPSFPSLQCLTDAQVSSPRLPRRHILLLCGHDHRCSRHTGPFLKDGPPVLHSADIQLPPLLPTAVRDCAVSPTSVT